MILAVLDDLMFSSKIKTAANGLGVDLRFSRSVDGALVEKEVVAVEVDGHVERALGCRHAGDVIDVRVREKDVLDRERPPLGKRQQIVDFVAGIDQDGLAGSLAADDETILHERAHRPGLQYHGERDLSSPR